MIWQDKKKVVPLQAKSESYIYLNHNNNNEKRYSSRQLSPRRI